jgi:hypothetical protein
VAGKTALVPTERSLITLSDLVRHAAAIVDPDGDDPAVVEFATRFEDADEPVRAILDGLDQRIAFGADEDPEDLLRLAARAEFAGEPPAEVTRWLADREG